METDAPSKCCNFLVRLLRINNEEIISQLQGIGFHQEVPGFNSGKHSKIKKWGVNNMKAVIDRFEGDFAIVLLGEEEIKVKILRQLLPTEAREGSWLKVNFILDPGATKKQEEKIAGLLEKLKGKNK